MSKTIKHNVKYFKLSYTNNYVTPQSHLVSNFETSHKCNISKLKIKQKESHKNLVYHNLKHSTFTLK